MKYLPLICIVFFAVSCANQNKVSLAALTGASQVGCSRFSDSFYDAVYGAISDDGTLPSAERFGDAIKNAVTANKNLTLSPAERDRLARSISDLYNILSVDALKDFQASRTTRTKNDVLTVLTATELGDQTTIEKQGLQKSIREKVLEIQLIAQGANNGCSPTATGNTTSSLVPGSLLANMHATLAPAVFGAWKSMATAYQSCDVLNRAPLTPTSPPVQGVSVIGTQSNGVGLLRKISNLNLVNNTDYYLTSYRAPSSSCFNVQSNPLIYKYGGKPKVTSDASPRFDFFTASSSQQKTLGIDCSGFVYSAYATAGLKMKRETGLKPIDVMGISAAMIMSPQNNGLTCLNALSYSAPASIAAGDLIAEGGHVVMIDHVGADPFGLNSITSAAGCTPKNMNVNAFDFVITQSAPVKNGIGINRYTAAGYFGTENVILAAGLKNYAASLCQAKFGLKPTYRSSAVAIVRHAGDPDCVDQSIALKNEECLNSCPATPPQG